MFGECHAHVAMNGVNYAQAMALHANGPDEAHIHAFFESYRSRGMPTISSTRSRRCETMRSWSKMLTAKVQTSSRS